MACHSNQIFPSRGQGWLVNYRAWRPLSEVWLFILQFQGLHCHFRGRISICVLASKLRVLVHTRRLKCSCRALGSSSEFLAVLVRMPDSIWISKTPSSGFEIWRGPTLAAVTLGFGKRAQRSLGMRWKRSVVVLLRQHIPTFYGGCAGLIQGNSHRNRD